MTAPGQAALVTGSPCIRCGCCDRYASSGRCVECQSRRTFNRWQRQKQKRSAARRFLSLPRAEGLAEFLRELASD